MFQSCICVDIDEVCRLLARSKPRARKVHRCGECRHDIQPGDVYGRDVTVFEGDIATHRTCLTCLRIRNSLFDCGWTYGKIWEDIHEAHCDPEGEDAFCICPEPRLSLEGKE